MESNAHDRAMSVLNRMISVANKAGDKLLVGELCNIIGRERRRGIEAAATETRWAEDEVRA